MEPVSQFAGKILKVLPETNFRLFILFLVIAFLNMATACTYYKIKTVPSVNQAQILDYRADNKYIILIKDRKPGISKSCHLTTR